VGVYYLIVNPAKREYIDPTRFGEGVKFVNLLGGGHCTLALKFLIADSCAGWWVGSPVILAADDTGPPNPSGLITTTPSSPARNLYFQAREEFIDISYRALALIARMEKVAVELADRAADDRRLLLDLGAVAEQYSLKPLELALERVVGRPWRKAYHKAMSEVQGWVPLPPIDQG
jgi:hypothetical protein